MVNCLECGELIDTKGSRRIYCSPRCRSKYVSRKTREDLKESTKFKRKASKKVSKENDENKELRKYYNYFANL